MKTITPNNEAGRAPATNRKLVRAHVVGDRLDVHKRTVELWAQKGLVPSYRIAGVVRFDLDEVLAALRKGARQ